MGLFGFKSKKEKAREANQESIENQNKLLEEQNAFGIKIWNLCLNYKRNNETINGNKVVVEVIENNNDPKKDPVYSVFIGTHDDSAHTFGVPGHHGYLMWQADINMKNKGKEVQVSRVVGYPQKPQFYSKNDFRIIKEDLEGWMKKRSK